MILLVIFQTIIDNIDIINNLLQLFAYILPSFLIIIKFFYTYRARELLKINLSKDDFKNLKYYITTHGQKNSPIDGKELNKNEVHHNLINFFIHDVFINDGYGRYFIILADSGMGKSTFLQMLFLKYRRKIFKNKKIYFFPLSNRKNLDEIKEIKDKYKSIILLDALDEDLFAIENYQKRMDEIIDVTNDFYKIIITCRIQFFPDELSEPKNIPLIRYGNGNKKLEFCKIYLSAFSNEDIDKFLRKKYKLNKSHINKAKTIISKSPDLLARPMLLTYIDDLLDKNDEYYSVSDIYKELIVRWMKREPTDFEILSDFTNNVILYMLTNNIKSITPIDILQLCKKEDVEIINPILARTRSLLVRNGLGEYKFAHYSIYEYLISYEAVYKNVNIRKQILTLDKSFNNKYFYELSYKKLMDGDKDLRFLDYSGLNIKELSLDNADLYNTNLENTFFDRVCLSYANLKYANLKKAKFQEVDLHNTILIKACLMSADLPKANLVDSKLCGADLRYANLNGANLLNADLRGANLEMANLENADLRNTNLEGANLKNTKILGVLLDTTGKQYIQDNFKEYITGLRFTELNKNTDIMS